MHTTDIERMRAQVRRTANKAEEIIEDADTIGDSGFDPSQSNNILQQQRELLEEVSQSLADFNELLNRAERVESDTIQYAPERSSLSVTYDKSNEEVTIEYTGDETIPNSEITVTEAGSEVTPFGGSDVDTGTSVVRDVSGLSDEDEVGVEVKQHRVQTGHEIRPWEDVLGQPGATAPSINAGDLQLPEHNLTEDTRTLTQTAIVDRTTNTTT